jgi:hypothetical protein
MGGASYAVILSAEFFSTFRQEGETLPICWLLSTGLRAQRSAAAGDRPGWRRFAAIFPALSGGDHERRCP